MSNFSNTSVNEEDTELYPDVIFSFRFRFWLFLFSNIFSIGCCLFVLYYFLFDRNLRQSLYNHSIIILIFICLIYELTDVSFILSYYLYGTDWHVTESFSLFWSFIDYGLYGTQFLIFSFSTIERYILIFYDRWLGTKMRCFFIHYFPLICISLYSFLYYIIVIFIPFCPRLFFQLPMHGVYYPCIYAYYPIVSLWELICHQLIPIIIIICFSFALFFRILWQKSRLNRTLLWRKQKKMAIQILSISIVFLIISAPGVFINISYELGLSRNIGMEYMPYAYFFSYYVVFLFPFVCLGTLPELKTKLSKLFCCQKRQRFIAPQAIRRNHLTHD